MDIQYKPSKPKKEKPAKAPKTPKAEKNISLGSAKAIKINEPKQEKPAKTPKATKPEKAVSFTPTKVEKATGFKTSDKLYKPMNPKVLAGIMCGVVAVICSVVLVIFIMTGIGDDAPVVKPEILTITKPPSKTNYFVGESAAFSDMQVAVTLSNGVSVLLSGNEYEIIGFDTSAPADSQVVTVKYKDLTAAFTVTVKAGQSSSSSSKYTELSFKKLPDKLTYKVGEWIDPTGGVLLVHYEDGSTRELELSIDYIYGYNGDVPGEQTITVKYVERGYYAETTYTITVTG